MGSEERIKDGAGQGQTLQKAVWRARSHGENIPQRMEYIHEKAFILYIEYDRVMFHHILYTFHMVICNHFLYWYVYKKLSRKYKT